MKLNRTAVAGVLVAAAVALPCAAWYVVGSRAVSQMSRELAAQPTREARRAAARLAERLHGRLDAIRFAESRRPFYEYENRYPDLSDKCACAPIIDSPLARGPDEQLIWTHFQIDRTTRISLPTLPGKDDETAHPEPELQRKILRALESARADLARAVWKSPSPPPPDFSAPATAAVASSPPQTVQYGDTIALMEPFHWYTVDIAGEPSLVAMRSVRPAEGRLIQGFVISRSAAEAAIQTEAFPVRYRPGGSGGEEIAESLELEGVWWEVAVSADEAIALGRAEAAKARAGFLRIFWSGTGAALLAAVFVVGLVGQTERLARHRSQFAASAAHELRTPLAGLRVYGEMLAENLGDPAKSRAYAGQVAAEAERLGRVVANVLGYTRLERGALNVRPQRGDLAGVVQEGVERLRSTLEVSGASLELDVAGGLPSVRFDRDAVLQILQNLVDNAERYNRGGKDRTIRVGISGPGSEVVLSVADRGPGISRKDRTRLFRPFVRGKDPDAPAGLGLGLALVGSLAKAQRASVRYLPNPEGGSIFEVAFPV